MKTTAEKLADEYAGKEFANKSSWEFHNQYTSFIAGYKANKVNAQLLDALKFAVECEAKDRQLMKTVCKEMGINKQPEKLKWVKQAEQAIKKSKLNQ